MKSRFITLAQEAGRSSLANGTAPVPLPLPEADRSDTEYFIAHAKTILPAVGVKILRSTAIASSNPAETSAIPPLAPSPVFEPLLKKEGITATAREVDGEFAVLQGSAARTTWTSVEHAYKAYVTNSSGKEPSPPPRTGSACDSPAIRYSPAPAPPQPP